MEIYVCSSRESKFVYKVLEASKDLMLKTDDFDFKIMNLAGIVFCSRSMIYSYFKNKGEIYRILLRVELSLMYKKMNAVIETTLGGKNVDWKDLFNIRRLCISESLFLKNYYKKFDIIKRYLMLTEYEIISLEAACFSNFLDRLKSDFNSKAELEILSERFKVEIASFYNQAFH